MEGLAKVAFDDFENDPKWNELYQAYQQKEDEYNQLDDQRDPELVAKNNQLIDRGANVGGGLGLGLGGLAGGALKRLDAKRLGNGPVKTGIKTIGGGLLGAGIGGLTGGITGTIMGLNRGEKVLQQDDPTLLANITEAGKDLSRAEDALYYREMELEFPEFAGQGLTTKQANRLDLGLAKIANEEKEKQKPNLKDEAIDVAARYGVMGGAYAGYKSLPMIDGMERLYHGTDKEKAKGIREKGLLASKAGQGIATQQADLANRVGKENLAGKVYLSRNPLTALEIANKESWGIPEDMGFVRSKIPYQDLQDGTIKQVENPELRGLSRKEFRDTVHKETGTPKLLAHLGYKELKAPNTLTVEGDLPTKYIKGSNDFQGQTMQRWKDYVKSNPGRFAKGLGLAGAGAGLVAGGVGVLRRDKGENEE